MRQHVVDDLIRFWRVIMNGTDVVDTGLQGVSAINSALNDEKFIFQLAAIIIFIGIIKFIFSRVRDKSADDEAAKLDKELVELLAKNGYDAEGNRLEGYEYLDEEAVYERRGTSVRPGINSDRVNSRHRVGSFDRRPGEHRPRETDPDGKEFDEDI